MSSPTAPVWRVPHAKNQSDSQVRFYNITISFNVCLSLLKPPPIPCCLVPQPLPKPPVCFLHCLHSNGWAPWLGRKITLQIKRLAWKKKKNHNPHPPVSRHTCHLHCEISFLAPWGDCSRLSFCLTPSLVSPLPSAQLMMAAACWGL